jgi:predicted Fe-Mo cluster-binding NifX family protein
MKIAFASENGSVAGHFGHCPEFTIFDVAEKRIKERKVIPNPGHQPGFLPRFLGDLGVNHIIAGGMGQAAVNLFKERDIEVTIGVQGRVDDVIEKFLRDGGLKSGSSMCSHGSEGHSCGGH